MPLSTLSGPGSRRLYLQVMSVQLAHDGDLANEYGGTPGVKFTLESHIYNWKSRTGSTTWCVQISHDGPGAIFSGKVGRPKDGFEAAQNIRTQRMDAVGVYLLDGLPKTSRFKVALNAVFEFEGGFFGGSGDEEVFVADCAGFDEVRGAPTDDFGLA